MPRPRLPFLGRWQRIVQQMNIEPGTFNVGNDFVYCMLCKIKLNSVTRRDIERHILNNTHQSIADRQAQPAQPTVDAMSQCSSRTSTFHYELAETLLASNIPFEKLNNLKFRGFLEKYTSQQIPTATTLRKSYVDLIYDSKLQKLREEIGNHLIYLSVDETSDKFGRCITHAIVGALLPDQASVSHLLYCGCIPTPNAEEIENFVNIALSMLWPENIHHDRLLLFVSDAAPYMMAAGVRLKNTFPKLIHVSCLAHGLHRVAETVRETYPNANGIIANTKAVFRKAPTRVAMFHDMAPGVPLPPEPIITRWGEWLRAASYYQQHYVTIGPVINALIPDAAVVVRAQELWALPRIENDFNTIHQNYCCIADAIKSLETQQLDLETVIDIITGISSDITENLNIPQVIRDKMLNVLLNNTGFSVGIMNIFASLQGEQEIELPEGWVMDDVRCMAFAPLTSCDTERSFSRLKNILTDKRYNLSIENLGKYAFINVNDSDDN